MAISSEHNIQHNKEVVGMARFVSPPGDQLNILRQPLTKGERLVFEFFNKHLPEEWEIYVQPHLNGLRPDFILLNPSIGIAVFEVKDWDLDKMDYWVEKRVGKSPILLAMDKDGQSFSMQKNNPVEKIRRYREEIQELYCPRLNHKNSIAIITAGIIFPFANEKRINDLFSPFFSYYSGMSEYPQYNPLTGADSLRDGKIEKVFPEYKRHYSAYMNETLAKDLRNWLVEPDFSATQRKSITLDKKQQSFVDSRTFSGYRRIKGPAGSGKSLILAARAAKLSDEGKSVLVVTYNITLMHYLRDVAARCPSPSGKKNRDITWLSFHHWCKRVCQISDHMEEYKKLWHNVGVNSNEESSVLNQALPELVASIIDNDQVDAIPKYDAILVDEGQDFRLNWWNILRKICNKGGEMLLAADATQDIYGNAKAWTDDTMRSAGFQGNWAELKISYRLPPTLLKYTRSFVQQFLPIDTANIPAIEQLSFPEMYPCNLRWVQTNPNNALNVCVNEILSMAPNADPGLLAIPDITFLTGKNEFGIAVTDELKKRGVKSVHTFSNDSNESRRKKMGFYMGDSRIKATTLHSFKGWESVALIIYIDENINQNTLALFYTGITRLKRNVDRSYLTIVSCALELDEYGRTWPEYEVLLLAHNDQQ